MSPRKPLAIVTFLCPSLPSQGEVLPQRYDYSYQLYQEDDDRIRIESHYFTGDIELNDETSFRFQWLSDAISGASPTGVLPGGAQPFLADIEDVRTGILGALSRQVGDHRLEAEISYSTEEDYTSCGLALSDTWELNQKNTTLTYGANVLDDDVTAGALGSRRKRGYDLFSGVSQIIDQNTVVSANLTIGYAEGYLNDPYKVVQRTETVLVPDGSGGTIEVPVVNLYRENRPDERFRQVLQFGGRHYFTAADGALDATLRLGHDDYGILSQTLQIEWRQNLSDRFQVVPFLRWHHQNAADFFVRTLDQVAVGTPSSDPDGTGPNYSADYRLSALDAFSGGLRLNWRINDTFSLSAAYERYLMQGTGSASEQSPGLAYPAADILTIGISATF
jgi:Protein of unknown function (DUF3570)